MKHLYFARPRAHHMVAALLSPCAPLPPSHTHTPRSSLQYVRRHRYGGPEPSMAISSAAAKAIHDFWLELRSGNQNWCVRL